MARIENHIQHRGSISGVHLYRPWLPTWVRLDCADRCL